MSLTKQQKKKRREKSKKKQMHMQKYANKYPRIILPEEEELKTHTYALVYLLKEALKKVKFSNIKDPAHKRILSYIKEYGWDYTYKMINSLAQERNFDYKGYNFEIDLITHWMNVNLSFELEKNPSYQKYALMEPIWTYFKGHDLKIDMFHYTKVSTNFGPAYYAFEKRCVGIEDCNNEINSRNIYFSKHTIKRINERVYFNNLDLYSVYSTFKYIAMLEHFNISNFNNHMLITLYDSCYLKLYEMFFNDIIDSKEKENKFLRKKILFKVGYGIVEKTNEGDLFVKTMLTPGMVGTPEYVLLHRLVKNKNELHRLSQSVENSHTAKHICENNDLNAMNWFQEHGLIQIGKKEDMFEKCETEDRRKMYYGIDYNKIIDDYCRK